MMEKINCNGNRPTICPICHKESDLHLLPIVVSESHRRPHPERTYHLYCYLNWAIQAWTDWLINVRGISHPTAINYRNAVAAIFAIHTPWTTALEWVKQPIDGVEARKYIDIVQGMLDGINANPITHHAWINPKSGFVWWLTHSVNLPRIVKGTYRDWMKDYGSLYKEWCVYLDEAPLSKERIKRYKRRVSKLLPFLPLAKLSDYESEDHTALLGQYGFLTWEKELSQLLTQWNLWGETMSNDLIPEIPEEPVTVGQPFVPRSIEIVGMDPSDVSTTSTMDSDFDFELEAPEVTTDTFFLQDEVPGVPPMTVSLPELLKSPSSEILAEEDLFCHMFERYAQEVVVRELVPITEFLHPTPLTGKENSNIYMFKHLYAEYLKVKAYLKERDAKK